MGSFWENELDRHHQTSMKHLRQSGQCPFLLRIYGQDRRCSLVWLSREGLSLDGRQRLKGLNKTFPETNPPAVLITSDSWQARMDKICERFGLPLDISFEDYEREFMKIRDEQFGGWLANFPDDLKGEALTTVIKGAKIGMISKLTFYRREEGKVIVEKTIENRFGISGLVPDWWPVTVQ